MRAVRLRPFDGTTQLSIDEVGVPVPGPHEALLKVRACGVNQVDLLTRHGRTPAEIPLPHTSGTEVAGDIVAVGDQVQGWVEEMRVLVDPVISCGNCSFCRTGSNNMCLNGRIYGVQTPGGYAEYALAPVAQLIELPATIGYSAAAAIAVTGPTAWHMLHRRAQLRLGEDVLIVAAGSGIGVLAVQIARLSGARVIATAGSDDKLARALQLGAHAAFNHTDPQWSSKVRTWTDGRGVDVVFEHVGAATWKGSLDALARGGRLVTSGGHSGFDVSINLWHLFVKEHTLIGSFAGSRQDLVDVLTLLERGEISPVIHQTVGLDGVPEAQRQLEQRAVFGKVLIDPTIGPGHG